MSWTLLSSFAGGIGLFLLGMRLMSDGLRIAAGSALRELLLAATGSRSRALMSGVLVTALVQSSSAVIFATIGFVNAGLLNLTQAVGLIFGANLGTTFTAWIVAAVGFKLDLQAFAMPAIAVGMGLWLATRGRRAALGQALVGFGVFFLGLAVLKDAFSGVGASWSLAGGVRATGDVLLYAGIGVVLTILMQSSSAALAVTLTAASQGLLPLEGAAALVIGSNIGTTSTALFASLGATAAARRSAVAHVLFNLIAGALSLALLPWLLAASSTIVAGIWAEPAGAAVQLAMLHTLVNLLGVALLWPWIPQMVVLLERHLGAAERADEGLPRYIDRAVLVTPSLAVEAVRKELQRMAAIAHRMARAALSQEQDDVEELLLEQDRLERLGVAIIEFVARIEGGDVAEIDRALPKAVRVAQYYRGMAERAVELGRLPPSAKLDEATVARIVEPRQAADRLLALSEQVAAGSIPPTEEVAGSLQQFEDVYQHTKADLLRLGSRAQLGPASLVRVLDRLSALRRIVEQAAKATLLMHQLELGSGSA